VKPALHSPQGVAALHRLLHRPALLAFDFDGTLAPICKDPKDARTPASWHAHLTLINRHWPIAVISGRQMADLAPRVGFEPAFLVGNHGAESTMTNARIPSMGSLDAARRLLASQRVPIDALGVEVEDKGMSLAVHYRRASRASVASAFVDRLLRCLPPDLSVSKGKAVFNITVSAAPDKGDALRSAMHASGVAHALFVGDDSNDEAAFAAASPGSVTVRIGTRFAPTHARFALATQRQLGQLLRTLARHCRR